MQRPRIISIILALVAVFALSFAAAAATTVVVTPANQQGWTAATGAGGVLSTVAEPTAPGGRAVLQMTTTASNDSYAEYDHEANVPLAQVTQLSFATRQVSGPSYADPAYYIYVDLNGAAPGGEVPFVYEVYYNGTVQPGVWQQWDVAAGLLWTGYTFTDGSCAVVGTGGGPPTYTLAGLKAACPNAVVIGFGVFAGSYNPNYVVQTDLVNFNGTIYDFEQFVTPTTKDQCKKDGWKTLADANGQPFKNQGDCVSYVATGGKH